MTPIAVYLAGPMLNRMNHNVEQFVEWAGKLRAKHYLVEAPHEWDRDHGFDVRGTGYEEDDAPKMLDMRAAMAHSLNWICTVADAVAVLPGWEKSHGATAQVLVSWRMHVPVFTVTNLYAWGIEAPQTLPGTSTIGNK